MITKYLPKKNNRGFTLFEVVITFIIAGILASFLYSYMGTNISHSAIPVVRVREGNELAAAMEMITADYRHSLGTNIQTWGDTLQGTYGSLVDSISVDPSSFSDGGGIESDPGSVDHLIKVTLTKSEQSVSVIFGD